MRATQDITRQRITGHCRVATGKLGGAFSSLASFSFPGSTPPGTKTVADSPPLSLQNDASRAQLNELHVQARVAAELQKLQAAEDAQLKQLQERLSSATPEQDTAAGGKSRQSVSKEVEALRAKLESRKKVRDVPESVETARSEVVRCLRENDRRPLDCWQEVERFKEEVRRLEKGWVDKVVR